MAYDYSRLLGRIKEIFGTNGAFAQAMGVSERTMSLKTNNLRGWKQQEMEKACVLLRIDVADIGDYFFKRKVQ